MRTAEDALERGVNRVQEIKNFARKAGIKRIGIAHCVSFSKESNAVKQYLSDEFKVYSGKKYPVFLLVGQKKT